MSTEKEIRETIFGSFEKFLNSNDLMVTKTEELKVVWAVRGADGKSLKGFLRIGRKHVPFYASFMGKNDLTVWITGIGHIFYPEKVIVENLKEER